MPNRYRPRQDRAIERGAHLRFGQAFVCDRQIPLAAFQGVFGQVIRRFGIVIDFLRNELVMQKLFGSIIVALSFLNPEFAFLDIGQV